MSDLLFKSLISDLFDVVLLNFFKVNEKIIEEKKGKKNMPKYYLGFFAPARSPQRRGGYDEKDSNYAHCGKNSQVKIDSPRLPGPFTYAGNSKYHHRFAAGPRRTGERDCRGLRIIIHRSEHAGEKHPYTVLYLYSLFSLLQQFF